MSWLNSKRKVIGIILAVFGCVAVVLGVAFGSSPVIYKMAESKLEDKQYEDAKELFRIVIGYSDARTRVLECDYKKAESCENAGQLSDAFQYYLNAAGYEDASTKAEEVGRNLLDQAVGNEKFEDAFHILEMMPDISDRDTLSFYLNGRIKERDGAIEEALQYYAQIDASYRDVEARIDVYYKEAVNSEKVSYLAALEHYRILPQNFKDVSERLSKIAAYEKILGTYRCIAWSQTNTIFGDDSMSNTEYEFTVDAETAENSV